MIPNKLKYLYERFQFSLALQNYEKKIEYLSNQKDKWNLCLKDLLNFGFSKLPISFDFQDDLESVDKYPSIDFDNHGINLIHSFDNYNDYGISNNCLSMNSSILYDLFSQELFNLISNFYEGDFYLRNTPFLRVDKKSNRKITHDQSFFHLDHAVRQLTIIIFLNTLDESSTHTQYIRGSNKKSWLTLRERDFIRNTPKFMKMVEKQVKSNEIVSLIGKKGEAYIFDAGNGLHKGFPGEDRSIIHITFNQSRKHTNYSENYEAQYREKAEANFHKNYFGPLEISSKSLDHYNQRGWTKNLFKYLI